MPIERAVSAAARPEQRQYWRTDFARCCVGATGQRLSRHGYQMACHAIGDAAIGQLITAYEKALVAMPDAERRHRIEHCGFSTAPQHRRMLAAEIYPVPQQAFIYDFGDSYISVLGEERALPSYPMRTWRDLGFKQGTLYAF